LSHGSRNGSQRKWKSDRVSFTRPWIFTRIWLYLIAGALIAAGFADFSLIAFHFQKTSFISQGLVPFYAVAMATGAIASLVLGKLWDKIGCQSYSSSLEFQRFSPYLLAYGQVDWRCWE
jgi:hypothetical protein